MNEILELIETEMRGTLIDRDRYVEHCQLHNHKTEMVILAAYQQKLNALQEAQQILLPHKSHDD